MDREQRRSIRIADLISDFPHLVDSYDRITPFTRSDQLEAHRRTIYLRRRHESPTSALNDATFIQSLYSTLQSWGIGSRASILVPIDQFAQSLERWSATFDALDDLAIDDTDLDVDRAADLLWDLISGVDIVENKAKIVALSKTIHHILPDLLPPIDRAYTQDFFVLYPVEFQDQQEMAFRRIWSGFAHIASNTDPASFIGAGWRTSRTKVIDNAIVASVLARKGDVTVSTPREERQATPPRLSGAPSVDDLYSKLDEFKTELENAGLKPNTVDTYVGRSKTFVDWLAGVYHPRGPNTE